MLSATATAQTLPILTSAWFLTPGQGVRLRTSASGIYFEFPQSGPGKQKTINYMETRFRGSIGGTLQATFQVQTSSPSVVFNYKFESGNTCVYPAHVRLYLSRAGWDTIKQYPPGDDYRWWSDPIAAELVGGSAVQLSVPLTPDQWTNVFGHRGDESPERAAAFQAALSSVDTLGLSFGGGCFFGHGVNVSGGSATFTLQDMRAF